MKIDLLPSSSSYTDEDHKNLNQLLEAFGSSISLEDMASTYCETGRSLELTAERLSTVQTSNYGSSFPKLTKNVENVPSSSSGCKSSSIPEIDKFNKSMSKKFSASMGTVSDVFGKDYMKPIAQSEGPSQKLKPVKISSDDFPASVIWDEKRELESDSTSQSESIGSDVQEFLYKMLGDGFQLEKSVIQDVIGQCGYDIPRSVDKLIELSAATLKESDDVIAIASGSAMKNSLNLPSATTQTPVRTSSSRQSNHNKADKRVLPETEVKKKDIQREILEALFKGPDRFEEKKPTRPIRQIHRSAHGRVVVKPPDEMFIEDFTYITRQPLNDRNDEENPSYEDLRKAVAEYWVIMKEYYKASADAFTKNECEKAQKLFEEGKFYSKKAREADELSAKKLTEGSGEEETFSVNVHRLEPKDALKHMKLHLTSFSGLPSIPYLKAVVGTDGGDKKDARRKHLITKLLEKEGIPWTEEGNGWIISIRADQIDPKSLSFFNK